MLKNHTSVGSKGDSPITETARLSRLLQLPELPSPPPAIASQNACLEDVDCLLLKGDNLTALNLLCVDFQGKIDFCYIDPPYNTGSKFIYDDKRYSPAQGIWGKHAAWMAFMLPRLVLMRTLLSENGIAAISIDDYEYAQLKIVLDHVFGSEHHLGTLVVNRSKNGKGSKAHIALNHEYVLVYSKSADAEMRGLPELDLDSYSKEDQYGRFKIDGLFRKKGDASRREDRPNMFYPLYYDSQGNVFAENTTGNLSEVWPIDSNGVERRWLWGVEKARSESWKLYASSKGVVYVKNYLTNDKRVKVRSLWDSPRYMTERATNEITEVFGEKVFETPKPLGLLEDLIRCCTGKHSLIIDFFCGTATTAHGAFNVNTEDSGSRKVILVEQSTHIAASHPAANKGFGSIADIAEFRLAHLAKLSSHFQYRSIQL